MKILAWTFVISTLLLVNNLTGWSQNTEKLLEEANFQFQAANYPEAIAHYQKILERDKNILEAKNKLAEAYRLNGNYLKAAYWYLHLIDINPDDPINYLQYARSLQSQGKCEQAVEWFETFAQYDPLGAKLAEGCTNLSQFNQHKNNYTIHALPHPINTSLGDLGAVPYQYGILFISNRGKIIQQSKTFFSEKERGNQHVFYLEKRPDGIFDYPKLVEGEMAENFHIEAVSVTSDQKEIWLTQSTTFSTKSRANKETIVNRKEIVFAPFASFNTWGSLKNFEHNNTSYSTAYPTLSADQQTIYFASDKPGGQGGMDIYVCQKIGDAWSQPMNLGPEVNTAGDEIYPFFHSDETLYFASDGHPGLGGFDVFYTLSTAPNQWAKATNLGAPINSPQDDYAFTFLENNESGFFTSNRNTGYGTTDLYSFEAKQPIHNLLNTTDALATTSSTIIEIPLLASFEITDEIGLQNLTFKEQKADLIPETIRQLDKIVDFLYLAPEITVEIGLHTDARNDDFINLDISDQRAYAARQYLIGRGIPPNRLIVNGYGESQLLNECKNDVECTDEQHEANNRVSIKVVSIVGIANPDADDSKLLADNIKLNTKKPEKKEVVSKKTEPLIADATPVTEAEDLLATSTNDIIVQDSGPNKRLAYKVHIGPFEFVDADMYNNFEALSKNIGLQQTPEGMIIVLGPYDTMQEAEELQDSADEIADQSRIVVVNKAVTE